MKKLCVLTLAFCLAFPAMAFADCKGKIAEIESQIAAAKAAGNSGEVAGLEEALANTKLGCDDDALKTKLDMKVEEKQNKVKKAEMELEEAKRVGKKDKIAKKEEKLEEAKMELKEAQAERDGN